MNIKTPVSDTTAFISYSWDSDSHVDWVNSLAHILRENSIKSLTDQLCVGPGASLKNFMRFGISASSWKVCVISDGYISKMKDLETGVGQEIEMLRNHIQSEFIIPVLRENSQKSLPDLFEGKFWVDFDSGDYTECVQKIVKRILGFDKMITPVVQANPYSKEIANIRVLDSEIKKTTFLSPKFNGSVSFDYSSNDGVYTIGSGEYSFKTMWSAASDVSIHAYNDKLLGGKIALIKNVGQLTGILTSEGLDFTSRSRTAASGDAVVWINKHGNMAVTKVVRISDSTRGATSDVLTFEYHIFTAPV